MSSKLLKPRAKEIKAFRQGEVEFRFLPLRESIFILAKVGDLRWQEAAFDPHMCKNLTSILTDVPDGLGMSILLLLADTATGILKCTRFISAGTEFTRQFYAETKARMAAPFDEGAWRAGLLDVQGRYSTEDMAEMALSRYRVGTRG